MNQLEVLSLIASGRATWTWVPLVSGIEVMAWPVMLDRVFLSVSARTASACAAALNRNGWMVSLTTPKVEDLIYEHAAARPEPILLDPQHSDVASSDAVLEHSAKLLRRLAGTPRDALVACGKNWVLCNAMLDHPGHAASYGVSAATAPYCSADGTCRLWQPLSLEHDIDYRDYSQLLRLVRRRPGTVLPSYDEPLRVFELVRECTLPITLVPGAPKAMGNTNGRRAAQPQTALIGLAREDPRSPGFHGDPATCSCAFGLRSRRSVVRIHWGAPGITRDRETRRGWRRALGTPAGTSISAMAELFEPPGMTTLRPPRPCDSRRLKAR